MDDNSRKEMDGGLLIWKVENIIWNAFAIKDPPIMSQSFTVNINGVCTQCKLFINPSRSKQFLEINLKLNSAQKSSISEKFLVGLEFSYVTASGNIKLVEYKDSINGQYEIVFNCGEWKTLLKDRLIYFNDGCYTFRCEMWTPKLRQKPYVKYIEVSRIKATTISYRKSILVANLLQFKRPIKCLPFPFDEFEIILSKQIDTKCMSVDINWKKFKIGGNIRLNCIMTVMDSLGIFFYQLEDSHLFLRDEKWNFSDSFSLDELKEKKMNALAEVIYLDFKLVMGTTSIESASLIKIVRPHISQQKIVSPSTALNSLIQDFENLYLDKKFSDIQLKLGASMFPAHKVVLCTRSRVFSEMFTNDMAEIKDGIFEIKDMDESTLEKLLLYLYTGQLKDLDGKTAEKLLSAANKYQILSLKEQCTIFLFNRISD